MQGCRKGILLNFLIYHFFLNLSLDRFLGNSILDGPYVDMLANLQTKHIILLISYSVRVLIKPLLISVSRRFGGLLTATTSFPKPVLPSSRAL